MARVRHPGKQLTICVHGQTARTLLALVNSGPRGVSALECGAWAFRLAAYCHRLRHRYGLTIRTDKESHPGGWHPQWILQRKEARARARSDGWAGNAYCTTRTALARNIVERCGDVDPAAMAVIEALPERHPRVSGRQQKGSI